ncbi:hypothetical protein [Brevibacterium moorei]|uniref:hypothetical protein n=1 Tax=Brevibacterium moorei TaxID=2968457 RepID=UPI00211C3AC0|nr:hypothetical protein [Brevibacterium sp. 68QC2CO]MCQ9384433.1 hypothetical protein [Brevibacterium sp. 68QC2CO]
MQDFTKMTNDMLINALTHAVDRRDAFEQSDIKNELLRRLGSGNATGSDYAN